jgi:hypothetical protein
VVQHLFNTNQIRIVVAGGIRLTVMVFHWVGSHSESLTMLRQLVGMLITNPPWLVAHQNQLGRLLITLTSRACRAYIVLVAVPTHR